MKQSTLAHSKSITYKKINKNNNSNSKSNYGVTVKFIWKTIIINICSLFVGLLPVVFVSMWRTFSQNTNFIYDILISPDIIFVGIALWVTYFSSRYINDTKQNSIFSFLNIMAIFLSIGVYTVEAIAREEKIIDNMAEFVIIFNIVFCILQLTYCIVASVRTKYLEEREENK